MQKRALDLLEHGIKAGAGQAPKASGGCAEGEGDPDTARAGDTRPSVPSDCPRAHPGLALIARDGRLQVLPQVVNYGILPYQRLRTALVPCCMLVCVAAVFSRTVGVARGGGC